MILGGGSCRPSATAPYIAFWPRHTFNVMLGQPSLALIRVLARRHCTPCGHSPIAQQTGTRGSTTAKRRDAK